MTSEDLFKQIAEHHVQQLPFVVYRKPNANEVKALLQQSDELFFTENLTEKGFVFSPFDASEKSILLPLETAKSISAAYTVLKDDIVQQGTVASNDHERQYHIDLVKKGIEAIKDNKFKKVVLSRSEKVNLPEVNPIAIFKRLLNAYPSAFAYCWFHPQIGLWLGATPETLIKIEGNLFSIMALAGTQDYTGTLNVNWKEKEKQEQQYVTDFIVNNLRPTVEHLKVSEVETVRAGNLVHLKTVVSARLKSATPLRQIIEVLHPTPAVCGLPKEAAKQFILKNENYNRTFYTGFLGELNMDKTAKPRSGNRNIENRAYAITKKSTQLYVNLRCMQIKGKTAILYVGGGITESSNPESEWQETQLKSLVVKNIL